MRRGTPLASRGCVRGPTHRSLPVHLRVNLALLLCSSLVSNLVTLLLDKKLDIISICKMRWTESSDFGPNSRLGHGILKYNFIPSDFAISDCNKADPFIRSKSKNLKLGIGSHHNLPDFDVTMCWYRVYVVQILPMCSVRG